MHGPISFEELTSKMERADGANVDAVMSDLIDSESDSDYALMRCNKRVLAFAKLVNIEGMDLYGTFLFISFNSGISYVKC